MKVDLILNFYGFCPGLTRSLRIADELAKRAEEENKKIYFDVPLAHNEEVLKKLKKQGFTEISNAETKEGNDNYFIVSAHGASDDKVAKLAKRKFRIVTATCPNVKKVQDIAADDYLNGYQIVIFGKPDHPEVIGINGNVVNTAIVVKTLDEAKNLKLNKKTSLISQTTFPSADYVEIIKAIKKNNPNVEIVVRKTICPVVERRCGQILEYIEKNKPDVVVVVGSKTSSNTKQIYNKVVDKVEAIMVKNEDELKKEDFAIFKHALIVSGTSAPFEIVEKAAEKLKSF